MLSRRQKALGPIPGITKIENGIEFNKIKRSIREGGPKARLKSKGSVAKTSGPALQGCKLGAHQSVASGCKLGIVNRSERTRPHSTPLSFLNLSGKFNPVPGLSARSSGWKKAVERSQPQHSLWAGEHGERAENEQGACSGGNSGWCTEAPALRCSGSHGSKDLGLFV